MRPLPALEVLLGVRFAVLFAFEFVFGVRLSGLGRLAVVGQVVGSVLCVGVMW